MRGSPIRKSSDQRSVDSSPRLIAASYVLHRLLVPRHPPCALKNLTNTQRTHTRPTRPRRTGQDERGYPHNYYLQDARVHCAVLKVRKMTAHPTPPAPATPGGTIPRRPLTRANSCPFPQDPTACLQPAPQHHHVPDPPPRERRIKQAVPAATPSHRPNWSAFHPRAPSRTPAPTRNWASIPVRARLWTTHIPHRGGCAASAP